MADARSGAELADYSKVAFSVGGVRQEISIDDWRNGWAAIVGGLNGKPTSQQFNMVFYILSVLLNQNISDVSAVKSTANAALPKESFTADAMQICWTESTRTHLLRISTAIRQVTLQAGICRLNAAVLALAPLLMRVVLLALCGTQAVPLRERSILQMAQRTTSALREMRILDR